MDLWAGSTATVRNPKGYFFTVGDTITWLDSSTGNVLARAFYTPGTDTTYDVGCANYVLSGQIDTAPKNVTINLQAISPEEAVEYAHDILELFRQPAKLRSRNFPWLLRTPDGWRITRQGCEDGGDRNHTA